MLRSIGSVTFLALFMVGCGGGDSGSPPPPPAIYTVGGTVTGISGPGLVLQLGGGADLPISASGTFIFSTHMPSGASYAVTVKSSPTSPPQVCTVAGGVGTIATTNVTNVDVTCTSGYTIRGTVSGLEGTGLILAICEFSYGNRGDTCYRKLRISANGPFTLDAAYPAGYAGTDKVGIYQQPSSPTQRCAISNATRSVKDFNNTSVAVSCVELSYVTNAADNALLAYSIDANTGALAVIGAPTAAGISPHAIVSVHYRDFANDKRYVFVGNEGSNDVSAFAVDATTGELTAVPGSPFPTGTDPQAIMAVVLDIALSPLYVANAGSDSLSAYSIDPYTGILAAPSTVATGKGPTSIVVVGNEGFNRVVFVANHGGSNDISAFHADLTPVSGSPFPAGGSPLSLALGAGGKFLYSANPDATNPSISGFSIDPTSALTPLSGSPFPLSVSHYMATDQTGAYLYVTSGTNVVGYAIDATTGALTALSGFPVAVGANAYSISVDPTNQFLFVTNDGAANISGFRVDASTGALTPIPGSPFPAGNHPEFMATF